MNTIDGDLLSAASITAGVLTALFTLWEPEVRATLATKTNTRNEDEAHQIKRRIKQTARERVAPLLLAAVLLTAVFAPPIVSIWSTMSSWTWNWATYDAVTVAFFIIELFLVVMVAWMSIRLRRLLRLAKKLPRKSES